MSTVLIYSPADITKHLLIGAGVGTLGPGTPWPIYSKRFVDAEDNAIFLIDTLGRFFSRSMIDGEQHEMFGFQLMIRSSIGTNGGLKIRQIDKHLLESVYNQTVAITGISFLVHAYSREGQVIPLGNEQGTKRELFVANYLTTILQTN